jgi:hypothetical protein
MSDGATDMYREKQFANRLNRKPVKMSVEKVYNPKTKRIDLFSRVTLVDDETGSSSSYRVAGCSGHDVVGEGSVVEYYLMVQD